MPIFKETPERQERRAQRKVRESAKFAADLLVDRQANRRKPPHEFNIGTSPKGLSAEEYRARVGDLAVQLVEKNVGRSPVAYDAAESVRVTAEMQAATTAQRANDIRIVFVEAPLQVHQY